MRHINILRGIIVSPEDEHLLVEHLFYISSHGYAKTRLSKGMEYLHRMICPGCEIVDHINRNKLDNRRENLREATRRINRVNQDKPVHNNSGYIGVTKTSHNSTLWSARITVSGKRIGLGSFLTKEEAAIAYDKAAQKYNGDLAVLNKIA